MATTKAPCQLVYQWLRDNFGKRVLGGLTSTDSRALEASVQIMELYACGRSPTVTVAFGAVVLEMQEKERWTAYHAIAMVLDWSDREEVWRAAGLPAPAPRYTAAFEPGGTYETPK